MIVVYASNDNNNVDNVIRAALDVLAVRMELSGEGGAYGMPVARKT